MGIRLYRLIVLVLALAAGWGILSACSSGDDDDDVSDDDDGEENWIFDECVDFFRNCLGFNEDAAREQCEWTRSTGELGECEQSAFQDYFDCLDQIDCDRFLMEDAEACYNALMVALEACD